MPTPGHHTLRGFLTDRQRAGYRAVVVGDGRITVRPENFLDPPVTKDGEARIGISNSFPARHHIIDLGRDEGPDFSPALRALLPHGRRMLADPENGDVRIIVKLNELGTPPEKHGLPRTQHEPKHDSKEDRPFTGGTQRRVLPLDLPNKPRGFSIGPQEAVARFRGSVRVHHRPHFPFQPR